MGAESNQRVNFSHLKPSEVKSMSEKNNGNLCFGIILIVAPIIALLFGSDEPAMQTDQAALLFTGMIFFGIIMIASANKKRPQTISPVTVQYAPTTPTHVEGPLSFCPHCGSRVTIDDAQYCSSCGKAIQSTSKTYQDGSFA